jgi:hypothetical protein
MTGGREDQADELGHTDSPTSGRGPTARPFPAAGLSRVTAAMDRRADTPSMALTGPGTLRTGTSPPVDVTGAPAVMLAWLSGRGDGTGLDPDGAARPAIPPLA